MLLFSPLFIATLQGVFCYEHLSPTSSENIDGKTIKIGPKISSSGNIVLYSLDHKGIFHRNRPPKGILSGETTYSVLKNGILIPETGPYSITYKITRFGDLIPLPFNKCIYKSDKPAYYLEGIDRILIPVDVYHKDDRVYYIYEGRKLLFSDKTDRTVTSPHWLKDVNDRNSMEIGGSQLTPDKGCNGDITLFLLRSNGVFSRNPPDEFLPFGMKIKYDLHDDGVLSPFSNGQGFGLTYVTAENGNLQPCSNNTHTLTTLNEKTKSYILGEGGVLAPVNEILSVNKSIDYFFDGRLVHSSKQFRQVYGNSSIVILSSKDTDRSETEIMPIKPGPKFVCPMKKICKRDVKTLPCKDCRDADVTSTCERCSKAHCEFAYDEVGRRIPLEPFVSECGKIVIFKLTCKGVFKRLLPFKEPEYGYTVNFKLLENFILVPTRRCSNTKMLTLSYTLLEGGNLQPVKKQKNCFKKAPASMVYYILGKMKELLPVRLKILLTNEIEVYFQDCLIYTICAESGKDLECFTTLYSPMYAYVNGHIVVAYADAISKTSACSTWGNHDKTPDKSLEVKECPTKKLYLVGPNNSKLKIVLSLNKKGVPVIYEMECNGLLLKSPKDENNNMCLKSFKLLNHGILMGTNETNCYIYLIDKMGNMIPYCFPHTKLRAPFGLTVKYVQCENDILLPVLIEYFNDQIRFIFGETIIYSRKVWTLEQIIDSGERCTCHSNHDEIELFRDSNGKCAYYELIDNVFKRCPCQHVEDYMVDTMGYLKILPCGKLVQTQYPDPKYDHIRVQIQQDGSLSICSSRGKTPKFSHYILEKNGNLCPVNVTKKNGYIKCYINGVRILKQKCDDSELNSEVKVEKEAPTPSGKDPCKIFEDPPPDEKKCCTEPELIKIPIKEIKPKSCCPEEKCETMRNTIKDLVCKNPGMMNQQIDMPSHIVDEICNLARKCCKTKTTSCPRVRRCSRRRVSPRKKSD